MTKTFPIANDQSSQDSLGKRIDAYAHVPEHSDAETSGTRRIDDGGLTFGAQVPVTHGLIYRAWAHLILPRSYVGCVPLSRHRLVTGPGSEAFDLR